MTPLFTIHAGEYLVGLYIERRYGKRFNVWIPSKDTGIDLLVSDRKNRRTASLQVKFGKDFLPAMAAGVTDHLWSVGDLVALWEGEERRLERAA